MDAEASKTNEAKADGEVVWSWRPDAGVKFRGTIREATVAKEPGYRGEHEVNRKPSRRECRIVRRTCGDFACVLFSFAHKAAGAIVAPAFPAPSFN
jgi:hypothetical protein